MQTLRNILQIIYYFIWIPLGILLFALIIFLIVANPIGRFLESGLFGEGPSGGSFGPSGGDQGGFGPPTGEQDGGRQFGPPEGAGR